MAKRMIIMLIAVGVVLGAVFAWEAFTSHMMKQYMSSMGSQPQTVSTVKAEYQEWQPRFEAVGTLRAIKGVDIAAEVPGIVEAIHFESGDDVKAGAALVSLRAENDVARLRSLEAAAKLAETTYERDKKQFQAQAISQAALDIDAANLQGAAAQAAEQRAVVEKKSIRAPFAGHLGLRQVDLGQYLNPGAPIVTLQALDPLYLDFYLPQQALSQIKPGQKAIVKSDAYPDKVFDGGLAAVNPKVDESTRNVALRALLPNPDHTLLPGMYATVDIETGAPQRLLTLPQTAVTFNPYGSTVFLVEEKGKDEKGNPKLVAKQSFVTTGEKRGDQVAILKGVNEGDTVVISGQIKLQNGTPVVVDNSIVPSNDAAPAPPDQ
ncbi:MAG: efflux RND transporter periplasmic adaptor subunit [Alphaproteobacteria bacterium]|nr:efflux RND transporter periplasmic adaptor subunit [Alphaproteobacteria bacterium]